MKRVASGVVRGLISLAVVLLVCFAIFVGLTRELVYQVDDFQAELVGLVNERTGLHLELESVAGSWKGLAPRFTMHGVALRMADSSSAPLLIETLDLEILLLPSLLHLEPRLRLHVDGAVGHAWSSDGRLVLSGFEKLATGNDPQTPSSPAKKTEKPMLDLILAQPRIAFTNSTFSVDGLYQEQVSVVIHQFKTEAGKRRRYLLGEFTANGPSKIHFSLKGKVNGSVFREGSLEGGLYAQVDNADWLPWIPQEKRGLSNATMVNLNGGGRFWINLSKGVANEIFSDFQFENVALETSNDIKPPRILKLNGKARWRGKTAHDWRLDLQDIRMQTPRFLWMPNYMNLESTALEEGQTRYRISVDDMDIEPWVNYYLGTQSTDSKLHKTLKKLRPAGQLQNVALELKVAEQKIQDYRFALTLNAFQNRPWKFMPGLYDVDIRAWGKKGVTLFKVEESYLELNYPQLFRDVITVNHADGNLILRDLEDQWLLQSTPIHVNSKHAQSATQLSLTIPKDKSIAPFLQLQATLRNADGKRKSLYLPAGILHESLLKWLDEAIVDGHLLRGDILVHGPLRKKRIEPLGVLLGFTAEQGVLQFLSDWKEPVRDAVADVVVDRGEVEAHITQGQYYEQNVLFGSVMLPMRVDGQPHVLSVKARTEGAAEKGFAILTQSPLRDKIGDFIEEFSLHGNMAVGFNLDVPLQSEYAAQIQSTTMVTLREGSVAMPSQNIDISNVAAQVGYDLKKGLSAESLSGEFLGGKLTGDIKTIQSTSAESGAQSSTIKLTFNGDTSVDAVNAWRPLPLLDLMSGPLQYKTLIDIPLSGNAIQPPHLSITSPIKQVRVDLPQPFGKKAGLSRPLKLDFQLSQKPLPLNIQYGALGNVALLIGDAGVERGAIHFGAGKASLPDRDILKVSGVLERFDDSEWLSALQKEPKQTVTSDQATASSQVAASDQWWTWFDDSELRVGELTLKGFQFGQTDLRLTRGQQRWNLWVNNDMATGKLELPDYILGPSDRYHAQQTPIGISLDRLHVATQAQQVEPLDLSEKDYEVWQPADVSPMQLPPLDIQIKDFSVGEAQLGSWKFQAKATNTGLSIPDLTAKVDGVTLSGRAQWTEAENNDRSTHFQGKIVTTNAAEAIKAMGGTPTLSSKSASAKGDLAWPGAPFEFALSRLTGEVSLKLKNGVFYNVSSNAVGKLWGALNFETLMRRLQLDFDDISESEMVYDELSGDIKLDRGILNLSKVKLNSPTIKMHAEGKVDIEHDALDVGLDVALPVTRNLVLPAAVIGGVPAAATAYVVEKMFGEQFDKLTTIKYQIKGTFNQPQVEVKDSFSIIPKQVGEAVMRKEQEPEAETVPQTSPESLPRQEVTP